MVMTQEKEALETIKKVINHDEFKKEISILEKLVEIPSTLYGYKLEDIRKILVLYKLGIFNLKTLEDITTLIEKDFFHQMRKAQTIYPFK